MAETTTEVRRNALAFDREFGKVLSADTLVEQVDGLLEGYQALPRTSPTVPDSVRFGKTTDVSAKVLADYTRYRSIHFSKSKCSSECPYCARARREAIETAGDSLSESWLPGGSRGGFQGIPKSHAKIAMKASMGVAKRKDLRSLADYLKKQHKEVMRLQGVWKKLSDKFFERYRAGEDVYSRKGFVGGHMAEKFGGTKGLARTFGNDAALRAVHSLDWKVLDVETDPALSDLVDAVWEHADLVEKFNNEIASLGQALR